VSHLGTPSSIYRVAQVVSGGKIARACTTAIDKPPQAATWKMEANRPTHGSADLLELPFAKKLLVGSHILIRVHGKFQGRFSLVCEPMDLYAQSWIFVALIFIVFSMHF